MNDVYSEIRLNFLSGPLAGSRIQLRDKLVIGRDAVCDICVEDAKVSRIHGVFERKGAQIFYHDNNSTNGSRLNGRLIKQGTLESGDTVQVGTSEIAIERITNYKTIQFSHDPSTVTNSVQVSSVSAGKIAQKLSLLLDHFTPGSKSDNAQNGKPSPQRLAESLRILFSLTGEMSRLLDEQEVLEVLGEGMIEIFPYTENFIILLCHGDSDKLIPKYARRSDGEKTPETFVSETVVRRALEDRVTLVANDAISDERLSSSKSIADCSVKTLLCTPLIAGNSVLGVIYLDNHDRHVEYDDLSLELATALANQAAIAISNARLCANLQESYHQMLQALVKAIEARDPYTLGHTQRVRQYSIGIAEALHLSSRQLERIGMAAELHDIGKIGIKEGIINKVGSLTDTEVRSIRDHVQVGERILEPINYLHDILPWIRGHHERWDGKGYPDGLKGEEIPLEARILAVADAYDAMTSQRSYNKPLSPAQALERIKRGASTHFDPRVVDAFDQYIQRCTARGRTEAAWNMLPSTSATWQSVTASEGKEDYGE